MVADDNDDDDFYNFILFICLYVLKISGKGIYSEVNFPAKERIHKSSENMPNAYFQEKNPHFFRQRETEVDCEFIDSGL